MQRTQERFIVSHLDQEKGPFTRDEIVAKLKNGELTVIDFVYVEEKSDWITLLEFVPDANLNTSAPKVTEPVAQKAELKVEAKSEPKVETKVETKQEQLKVVEAPKAKAPEKTPPQAPEKKQASPESARVETAKPEKVELKGGQAEIDLVHFAAGQMRLKIKGASGETLELPMPVPIEVKAAPAEKISMTGPSEGVAGEECVLSFEATDKYGNRDESFSGSITLTTTGSAQGVGVVKFKAGRAETTIVNKVAERIVLKMTDSEKTGLDVSSQSTILFKAGQAAKLVLVAPQEVVAGQPAKVTVKAVDAFGNLATSFGGEVKLEVDAEKPTGT